MACLVFGSLLSALPRTHWPAFLRGDCSYGNEVLLVQAETRAVPHLFKLRHTAKVKLLVAQMQRTGARWQDAGDGWEVCESSLKLSGWTRARRVVLVREVPAMAPVGEQARRRRDHTQPMLPETREWVGGPAPWAGKIANLVTTLDEAAFPAVALAQLYHEQADAENIYDELKNRWGWNGYTTQALAARRLMANLIALFYNWWNLYARLYDHTHHREAIHFDRLRACGTSRPALLCGVGRLLRHGGQRTVKVSLEHEKSDLIGQAITYVSNTFARVNVIAERWTIEQRWTLLLTYILRHRLGGKWLGRLPPEAAHLLSG